MPVESRASVAADSSGPLPANGLVIRRAPNPHYRSPVTFLPVSGRLSAPRQAGFDHVLFQLTGRSLSTADRFADGRLVVERIFRETDRATLDVDGTIRDGSWHGRTVKLEGKRGPWAATFGDFAPVAPVPEMSFSFARGVLAQRETEGNGTLSFLAGGPTPFVPGHGANFLALAGEGLRTETTRLTAAAAGFHWSGGPYRGASGWAASLLERAPLLGGTAGAALSFQRHDLDGRPASAAALGFEWKTLKPGYALSLRERHASDDTRLLTSESPDRAPTEEVAAEGQWRFWRGRAELHSSATRFAGGDAVRNWQSTQVGGSSKLGSLPWYAGGHASWDLPGTAFYVERRQSVYVGRSGATGPPLMVRALRTAVSGYAPTYEVSGQTSFGLSAGTRLSIEPTAEWRDRHFDRAGLATGVARPLPWPGARVSLRLRVDTERARDYRLVLSEAYVGLSLRPRPRDRWDLEARRTDDVGGYEMTSTYDLQQARYAGSTAQARRHGASDVVVSVVSTDKAGVEGILVSLDGKELRFTDKNGEAVFESVPPGVHEITVEERTVPEGWRIDGSTRSLVPVESGSPATVRFDVARLERRTKF